MEALNSNDNYLNDNKELRTQLDEALETINAIRTGRVDALIVQGEDGNELYTLKSADQTYRVFIERMNEGAVTLNLDGTILYSNTRFATMVNTPLEKVIGQHFKSFIPEEHQAQYHELIDRGWSSDVKDEIYLINNNDHKPCLMSCNHLELEDGAALSLILTDLTAQKEAEKQLMMKNEQLKVIEQVTRGLNRQLEALISERTQELDLSREQFKFLADHLPVIVWTANSNGDIDYYNKRWFTYTGLDFEETKDWEWKKSDTP